MELTEQQHAAWLRPDGPRVGNPYESGILPPADLSEMFSFPDPMEGNGAHMNRSYYSNSTRAMGYGSTHGNFIFNIVLIILSLILPVYM